MGSSIFKMCFIIYNKAFFLLPLWPTLHIFMFVLTGLTVNINMTFLGWRQQIKPNKTHVAPKCPVSKGFYKVPSSCSYSGLLYNSLCVCVLSHVRLCNPMDCGPQGSSVQGIFQAILEWVAISFSKESSQPRDQTLVFCLSCTGRQVLYH